MLWNLLTSAESAVDSASSSAAATGCGGGMGTWLMMGMLVLIIVVFMVFNKRSQKKRADETNKMLDAIQPGNKVKTIGGICGIVVEVCPEDNTFILETGSEKSGKSYFKFDRQAVYQTDAVAKPAEPAPVETAEEKPEEPFEEAKSDEINKEE